MTGAFRFLVAAGVGAAPTVLLLLLLLLFAACGGAAVFFAGVLFAAFWNLRKVSTFWMAACSLTPSLAITVSISR
jgi:hypothetical protein